MPDKNDAQLKAASEESVISLNDVCRPPADFHIHTTFCDGNNTPEQMAETAFKKRFKSLGFSAHSAWPVTTGCEMNPSRFDEYKDEIMRLKKLYRGRMNIFLGLEIDYMPHVTTARIPFYSEFKPDYSIGSIHYIHNPEKPELGCFAIDHTIEHVASGIRQVFGGDSKAAVMAYFAEERDMIETGGFDIIGHIDLAKKRNAPLNLFCENDGWYKYELMELAKTAAKSGKFVEINTGGMARGAISETYPSQYFLELLKARNVPVVINSDAHSTEHIGYAFDAASVAAVKAGYKESFVLTADGWKPFRLV